jgi:gamma-glutamylcyclotransferase (GGCT)/AIG2-like uncharacterized protein YtfP
MDSKKKPQLFIYGSLKRGHFNHTRLGMDKFTFLKEYELPGWKLVSLGSYPGMVRADSSESKVKGEIYEISSMDSKEYQIIYRVEANAGFEEREVNDEGLLAFVYLLYEGYEPEVPNGEWLP